MLLFKMAQSVLVNKVCVMSNKPYQSTHLTFSGHSFSETVILSHSFQASWLNHLLWLHYDVGFNDNIIGAFCFIYCEAVNENKVNIPATVEPAFLDSGYTNWKDATRNFENYQESGFHKSNIYLIKSGL